ncbi:MAG: hypothetical protein ACRDBG_19155, partial [Waterburya sp.]
YYNSGLYYSNGTTWEFMNVPYQATQLEVDTGTNTDKFVTPKTLNESSQLAGKVPYTGATSDVDLGNNGLDAKFLKIKGTSGDGKLGLKHQSSPATASGGESVLYADNLGNPAWKNDGNPLRSIQLDNSANTATNYTTPLDDDKITIWDTLNGVLKSASLTNVWTNYLKPKADALYATISNLALKQDFATDSFASTITFDVPKVYNSFSSPSSSDISQSLTGARIGVVQKFYSNKATEPTYPAGWVKLSGTYTNSVTNIIYAEWCEGSRVEYWIVEA